LKPGGKDFGWRKERRSEPGENAELSPSPERLSWKSFGGSWLPPKRWLLLTVAAKSQFN
jgi:hypothetical protein